MKYLLLALILASVAGCATDNRREIAMATLYGSGQSGPMVNGRWADPIFTAALNAKFPRGTIPNLVRDYVAAIGGGCYVQGQSKFSIAKPIESQKDDLRCSFVEHSGLCMLTEMAIHVSVEGGLVKDIEAVHQLSAC